MINAPITIYHFDMPSLTETGFLKVTLEISTDGPMNEQTAEHIQDKLRDFFHERDLNVNGKMSYVRVTTFEGQLAVTKKDTSA